MSEKLFKTIKSLLLECDKLPERVIEILNTTVSINGLQGMFPGVRKTTYLYFSGMFLLLKVNQKIQYFYEDRCTTVLQRASISVLYFTSVGKLNIH